jgi:multidrug efflux pump
VKFSQFFIKRPIFAAVLSLLIVVAGALALVRLPISEYPSVVPPTVVVRGVYPGANPKVIAETVASPLEQQLNGIEGLLYMFSQATVDGRLTLTVTFALGTDLDNAQVQVQNRVSQALPRLPQDVQRIGITTEKATPDFLLVAHLVSPDERYDMLYLSNFAHLQVKDELARIPGVGSVQVFGAGEYSMRVWLDPDKLSARQLTATDVVRAIREQNVQVAAGVLGSARKSSLLTSWCARRRKVRSHGFVTWAASSSARTCTRCAASSTISRRWRSASPSGPGRTRSKPRRRSMP